jgi:acyl-CoA dehydrogenase
LPDGTRNDVVASGIEHKLGMHGAPTCTMIYSGAVGWRIGEENRGLNCMFTMMNNARLLVGVQGVGVAERATQTAIAFAKERKQGRAAGRASGQSAIIEHPDVQRMLLDMQSKTMAARMICMATAMAMDAKEAARAALLTPLAKAYSTDIAVEVASICVQVHGGMGYIEEAGAAQLLRDARILPIYEGTNGIQAADLATRKTRADNGVATAELFKDCSELTAGALKQADLSEAAKKFQALLAEMSALTKTLIKAELQTALLHSNAYLRALSSTVASAHLLRAAQETEQIKPIALYFLYANALGDVGHLSAAMEMPQAALGKHFNA